MPEPTPDTTATDTAKLGRGLEPDVTIDDLPDPTEPPRKEFTGALRPFAILDRGLGWFEAFILTAGVLLMAASSVSNVIGRFVFGRSLYFAEEVNQYLIILITFAGIGFAARNGRHIRMSAFYDMLPPRFRRLLMIAICVVTAAIMFLLAWYAWLYLLSVYNTGRIGPATRLPIYLTLVWLPVGFVVTGVQYLLTALANATREEVYISATVVDSYDDPRSGV
jgi:C4-dicarboxylate transporter, DctQ subunit